MLMQELTMSHNIYYSPQFHNHADPLIHHHDNLNQNKILLQHNKWNLFIAHSC